MRYKHIPEIQAHEGLLKNQKTETITRTAPVKHGEQKIMKPISSEEASKYQ